MTSAASTFDQAAANYEQQLQLGLSLSGETADFFVEGRLTLLATLLQRLNFHTDSILDFGCGVGNAAQEALRRLNADSLVGLDCSAESIAVAGTRYPGESYRWCTDPESIATNHFDLIHTSGVFHHIELQDRDQLLKRIFQWLRPGGLFAFFENNPWNPGTRWVMSRIPFDRDAICLPIPEARERLLQAGFEIIDVRTLFYFPSFLSLLRPLERFFQFLPCGAQYLILCRRPNEG